MFSATRTLSAARPGGGGAVAGALVWVADILVGLSFGAITVSGGLPPWLPVALSLLVFAGGAQFAAVGAVLAGAASGGVISDTDALSLDAAFPAVLLALVVPARTDGQAFAGWARPAGVTVAAVLAVRRAPFPVILVAAAGTTAGLRLLGVP